jgi:hypothetical protein
LVPRQPIWATPPEDYIEGAGRDEDHRDLDASLPGIWVDK